jgi:hypothetical protein
MAEWDVGDVLLLGSVVGWGTALVLLGHVISTVI